MTRLILFLIFSGFASWTMGQSMTVLQTNTQSVTATINLAQESLQLTQSEISSSGLLSNLQLSIQNGELLLSYELNSVGKTGQYYEVLPEFSLNGKIIPILAHDELRGDFGKSIQAGNHQILWINLLDTYLNLEGELEVSLTANLWGERILPYDCSKGIPQFTSRQRLPYYLAAGVGAASIGIGQIFDRQSDQIYQNDYPNAGTYVNSVPIFEKANRKHQTYLVLTWAGSAILAADAILFLLRQNTYQKNLKLYNQLCGQGASLSLAPAVRLPSQVNPSGMTGLNVRFSF